MGICSVPDKHPINYAQYYRFNLRENEAIGLDWVYDFALQYHNMQGIAIHKGDTCKLFMYVPNKFIDRMKVDATQTLILPPSNHSTATLVLDVKQNHIDSLRVVLSMLNDQEEIVQQTSSYLPLDSARRSYQIALNSEKAKLLRINLQAIGNNREKMNILRIFSIDVLINGRSIAKDTVPQTSIVPIKHYTPTPQQLIPSQQFPAQARIIAFGESVHHNPTLQKAIYNNILQLVKTKQSRLILVEQTPTSSLALQYYIDHPNYPLYFPIAPTVQAFLDSLRTINESRNEKKKIVLAGIDINSFHNDTQGTLLELYDFLTSLPNWQQQKFCYPLLIALAEQNHPAALQAYQAHQAQFQRWLSPLLAQTLQHHILIDQTLPKDYTCFNKRDSMMAENLKWFTQQVTSPKTLLYLHAQHIAKGDYAPLPNIIPMGHTLAQEYGETYFPLLFTYGTDDNSLLEDSLVEKRGMQTPPIDSFEGQAMLIADSAFYVPLDKTFDQLQKARFRGMPFLSHCFFPMNLYRRFSGAFFLKHCPFTPIIFPSTEARIKAHDEAAKKRRAKVKQLRQLIAPPRASLQKRDFCCHICHKSKCRIG